MEIRKKPDYFVVLSISLCLLYVLVELFLNQRMMFSVDEFWFAHRAYQYKDGLPYRDFAPYKTVLGYYILLLPLLISKGILHTLFITKNYITFINAFILFATSLWLRRFYSSIGILLSLAFLVCSDIVLSYSTNIRVDLFGYWFGFISLLFLLERRYVIAGIFLGLGFITTQKTIWYLFASNVALGLEWLLFIRSAKDLWKFVKLNLTIFLVIACYFILFSLISDFHTVVRSVFYEASAMYQLDWYAPARALFWTQVIYYNPVFYALAPLTLISLFISYQGDQEYRNRFFICLYALTILMLLIPYKQVFPYYMQVLIPAFFTLYAAFFGWFVNIIKPQQTYIYYCTKGKLLAGLFVYIVSIIVVFALLPIPLYYLLTCLLPIGFIGAFTLQNQPRPFYFSLFALTILFMGIINPLRLSYIRFPHIDGSYQQANVKVINALVADNHDYIAGIEMIYNKTQRISGMRHLHGPALAYLFKPSAKLRTVMFASLYEDPTASVESIIAAIRASDVKFYVNNYRIDALPEKLKSFLESEYEHLWGSIYIYAPNIAAGNTRFKIKFPGKYLIETANDSITLNQQIYRKSHLIYLKPGEYASQSAVNYRLKLIPDVPMDAKFQEDRWAKII